MAQNDDTEGIIKEHMRQVKSWQIDAHVHPDLKKQLSIKPKSTTYETLINVLYDTRITDLQVASMFKVGLVKVRRDRLTLDEFGQPYLFD